MAQHTEFGKKAEQFATAYLEEKGYHILARNFRFQKAEIDIIAEFQNTIIIIEVKARGIDALIEPHEAVNKRKIRLIVSAADEFMKERNSEQNVRFDIISVVPSQERELELTHIEGAFDSFDAN